MCSLLVAAAFGAGFLPGLTAPAQAQSNSAPTVDKAIPDLFAKTGSVLTYAFPADTFTDSDEDTLTYQATLKDGSSLPEWLNFHITQLILTGIPADRDVGTLTISVTADDGNGGTVSDEFDLTVATSAPEAVLSLSGPANALEGDSGKRVLTYTASLSKSPSENVLFKVCFHPLDPRVALNADRDGSGSTTWQAGADYRLLSAGTPTASACSGNQIFLEGTPSLSKTIQVEVRGDTDVERDEAFVATLELTLPTQGAVLGRNRHTHWLLNDDHGDARMVVSQSTLTITEGQSTTFTVKLSEQPTGSGFQSKEVSLGPPNLFSHRNDEQNTAYFPSAENPVLAIRPLTRTFTPSNYATPQTFTVFALPNDGSADVTTMMRLQGIQKLFAGEDRNYRDTADGISVTIRKATTPSTKPVVDITPAVEYAAEEGGKSAKFTVSRTGPTTSALAVNLFVTEKTGGGRNFLRIAKEGLQSILIPAGQSSAVYTAPIWNDGVDEPDGEVRVSIRASGVYDIDGAAGKASVPVYDNDGAQIVSIEAGESPVTEGQDATFTIRRTGGPITGSLNVLLGVEEKDANAGDFVAPGNEGRDKTVSIPANQFSATYTVPTVDDTVDEPDGPVSVWIRRNDSAYLRHEDDTSLVETTVTVNDNDDGGGDPPPDTPVASFASAASSAVEDAGTRNVAFGLSPAPASDITVVLTRSGTASEGQDYAPLGLAVAVPAGTASVDVPVAITDDADDEPNETVILTLTAGTGYAVGTANVHTLTITDNDDPPPDTPVVSISGGAAVTEGGDAAFTLTASPAPSGSISVQVSVAGGGFAAGGARTVAVGASGTASFTVATVDDDADEPDGPVRATVQSGTGYSPHNTNASASVTVRDNDDSGDPGPDPDPDPDTGSGGSGGGSVAD
ncbi:MAG: hypothetical protein F4Y34_13795, partial [Gammaproteobacteria bacterium]|nr:hypothetical protein [Gammaproteobacteria bacterium]